MDSQSKKGKIWEPIFGLIFLSLIIYVCIWLIKKIFVGLTISLDKLLVSVKSLDAVVIVALITGCVSILGVLISSVIAKYIEYRQKRKHYLYEKKEQPYTEFLDIVYKIQNNANSHSSYTEEEMMKDISQLSKKLTLWGSNRVIKRWIAFRETAQNNPNTTDILFRLEEIIFLIRKDMGQTNFSLQKGDFLKFFINDVAAYLQK